MSIVCKVLRPLMLRGERQEAGATVRVSAAEAALLLESTRAELVDKADMAAVRAAVGDATTAALRKPAASCGFDRDADGPWQRRV